VQKQGKSVGNDGIAMEAYIGLHGGSRLDIHILHFCLICLPGILMFQAMHFMKCIIVPLVKCKTGDLSDVLIKPTEQSLSQW
jgi:hypothetical protein